MLVSKLTAVTNKRPVNSIEDLRRQTDKRILIEAENFELYLFLALDASKELLPRMDYFYGKRLDWKDRLDMLLKIVSGSHVLVANKFNLQSHIYRKG